MKKGKFLIMRQFIILVKISPKKLTVNKMHHKLKLRIRKKMVKIRILIVAELVIRLKREKNIKNSVLITIMDMMMKKEITK